MARRILAPGPTVTLGNKMDSSTRASFWIETAGLKTLLTTVAPQITQPAETMESMAAPWWLSPSDATKRAGGWFQLNVRIGQ